MCLKLVLVGAKLSAVKYHTPVLNMTCGFMVMQGE